MSIEIETKYIVSSSKLNELLTTISSKFDSVWDKNILIDLRYDIASNKHSGKDFWRVRFIDKDGVQSVLNTHKYTDTNGVRQEIEINISQEEGVDLVIAKSVEYMKKTRYTMNSILTLSSTSFDLTIDVDVLPGSRVVYFELEVLQGNNKYESELLHMFDQVAESLDIGALKTTETMLEMSTSKVITQKQDIFG